MLLLFMFLVAERKQVFTRSFLSSLPSLSPLPFHHRYIINAPFFFHKVFHLISCMMNQELKDRLKVLNRKQSLVELSKIMPSDVAQAIVEGDHKKEREEERELHAFLDGAAKEGLHKRRWGMDKA